MEKDLNKYLICMRGLPGAGKTTIAEHLASIGNADYSVISADDYFMVDGEYKFHPDGLGQAHAECFRRTEEQLQKFVDNVFVANTFTTDREIKPYKELADKYGYRFVSLIVENRHGNVSIHGVPAATMEKMKERFSFMI